MSLRIQSAENPHESITLPPIEKDTKMFSALSVHESQETPLRSNKISVSPSPKQNDILMKKISLSEQSNKNSEKEPEQSLKPQVDSQGNEVVENSQEQPNTTEVKKVACWKRFIISIIEHWSFTSFMTILTVYALFGDDIRIAATDKPADAVFYSLSIVCLFFFSFEITCSCFVKDNYWLGFFFWLDLLSTLSLIPDIAWIWNPIIGNSSGGTNAAQTTQIARAGRASRAGTRAGRVIRIIRLIRLIRIVKLYKISQQAAKEAEGQNEDQNIISIQDIAKQIRGNQNSKDSSSPAEEARSQQQRRKSSLQTNKQQNLLENQAQSDENQGQNLKDTSFSKKEEGDKLENRGSQNQFGNNTQTTLNQNKQSDSQGNQIAVVDEASNEEPNQNEENEEKIQIPEESKVGKKLSELTTKRVIILVLAMMFGLQAFVLETYVTEETSYKYGLEAMDYYIQKNDYTNFVLSHETFISLHKGDRIPLVYLEIDNVYAGVKNPYEDDDTKYEDLRTEEMEYITLTTDTDYKFYSFAVFDIRADTRLGAILSIIRTNFICVVLAVGSILFSKDTNDIILGPIENMIQKVTNIAKNPLKAVQEEEQLEYEKAMALQAEETQKKGKKKKKKEAPMETEFLEKTITQIGALLALGFGEAGSEVIAQNMQTGDGEVNPMIPGKKTMAIFGFCDIRNFTDATEVLQEGVMVFVNEIAEIVHSIVDLFSGSANKNIGDAFLLVWKFPDNQIMHQKNKETGQDEMKLKEGYIVQQTADMACISFLKIVGRIFRSGKLLKYANHEGLNARMPNYRVRMGFGLHVGWSIEGAIGSEFKIDASYLSPNVNMAARLEAATKQFGVPLLFSGQIIALCSPQLTEHLRQIDRVTVKGSNVPLDLFTCDVDPDLIISEPLDNKPQTQEMRKKKKIQQRMARNNLRDKVFDSKKKMPVFQLLKYDNDIQEMRKNITPEFLSEFRKGFQEYIAGNWENAHSILLEAQKLRNAEGTDGPTKTILSVIKENGGKAPSTWKGYRELTEK